MAKKHHVQSRRIVQPDRHTGWCKLVPIKAHHVLIHATLGFLEYHITDVVFHHFAGTDATTLLLGMLGGARIH